MEEAVRTRSARGKFSKRNSARIARLAWDAKIEKKEARGSDSRSAAFAVLSGVAVKRAKNAQNDSSPSPKRTCAFSAEGRRIVHLRTLAEGLSECKNPSCMKPLVLADCERDNRYGLASVLSVPCKSCEYVNKLATDTRVESTEQSRGRVRSPQTRRHLSVSHPLSFFQSNKHNFSIMKALLNFNSEREGYASGNICQRRFFCIFRL